MSPLLDDDELTALLEKQAFSAPAWHKALFFFALLLFMASLYQSARQIWQETAPHSTEKWLELKEDGLHLIEVAPGVDIERDVCSKMAFRPIIDENLKTMDPCLFTDAVMGFKLPDGE